VYAFAENLYLMTIHTEGTNVKLHLFSVKQAQHHFLPKLSWQDRYSDIDILAGNTKHQLAILRSAFLSNIKIRHNLDT
jgi:hypothetical protein